MRSSEHVSGSRTNSKRAVNTSIRRVRTEPAPRAKTKSLKSKILAGACALCALVLVGFYSVDAVQNNGVIHANVRVGNVDVGQLDVAAAAQAINDELTATAQAAPVVIYSSEQAQNASAGEGTLYTAQYDLSSDSQTNQNTQTSLISQAQAATPATANEQHSEQTSQPEEFNSWNVTLNTFDAHINGEALAEEAYGVGRGADFILGRPAASLFGVVIKPRLGLSAERITSVGEMISISTGMPMQNASITFDGAQFRAHEGKDGMAVDEERFASLLEEAFLSDNRTFVAPMIECSMQVTLEEAQQTAEIMQEAIKEPVTITYNESSWVLSPEQLGHVSTASVEELSGNWKLVPHVDAELLKTLFAQTHGSLEHVVFPVNASYKEVEGELQIVPEQDGTGADFVRLAKDIETLLYHEDEGTASTEAQDERVVQIQNGDVEPEFTKDEAEAYDFSQIISQYTINYEGIAPGSAHNLENTANLVNSSIIAPRSVWSLTGIVQEYTTENGFVMGQIIVGNGYQEGMGGGVCNIATLIFNTVYEAGYPIVERQYHTLRSDRYPLARDAAIAYPIHDLKFENDTDNPILLTVSYNGVDVTCTLWGVPPGYTVESHCGELIEKDDYWVEEVVDESLAPGQRVVQQHGMRGSEVQVTRYVYDAAGNLKEEKTFRSQYDPLTEIVRVGA